MELSTFISDVVLAACATAAYRLGASGHERSIRLLWGVFFGAVALTAALGAIRSLDNAWLAPVTSHVGLFGATVASACLGFATWAAVIGRPRSPTLTAGLAVALAVFLVAITRDELALGLAIQGPVVLLVLVVGVVGARKAERRSVGLGLFAAAVVILVASISRSVMTANHITTPLLPIDLYHYLLAVGMLLLGWSFRLAASTRHRAREMVVQS